ncbi:MAG: winged helix-turn-helix domain-containing protein [Burkholderiales bacterium]|nr:MAG: winged helix-turn-helix domain-containing protein [Burkholderiales bacterium]
MLYRCADWEIDTARFELRLGGVPRKIEPQVFEILCYLVQRHGEFVGKEELHQAIWKGRIVSDATISSRIKAARRAIGDDGRTQGLIRTVHGRGFCFVGPVVEAAVGEPAEPSSASRTVDGAVGPVGSVGSVGSAGSVGGIATDTGPQQQAVLSADVHLRALLDGDGPPEAAEHELLSWRQALRASIEAEGGRVIGASGGGVSACFEGAADAARCALELGASSARAGPDGPVETAPMLRIGICAVDAGETDAAALAARLQCAAPPGQIYATAPVVARARGPVGLDAETVAANLPGGLRQLQPMMVDRRLPERAPGGAGIPQLQWDSPVAPRNPSVVILPFQALGRDERAAELAEGLRIDIQNALTKISRLLLIAAGSANAFRDKSPEMAARSLGVRYVLHGGVQVVKQRARISLELIDTLSTLAIWAEQFEVPLADSFEIQDDITRKVVTALDVKLYSGEQARIWHHALTDPGVVRVFYRGVRLFFRMDREAMAEARHSFEAVAQLRPESSIGPTWTALCHWNDFMRRWGDPRTDSRALARKWAEAATRLPDADGQAHTVLAHVRLLDRDFEAALDTGREALEIRPGCANANGFFGNVLHYCGEQHDAILRLRRSIRLQPVYPPLFASLLSTAYLAARQPESALAVAKEALRLNPRDLQARLTLVAGHQVAGRFALARLFADEILETESAFSVAEYRERQPYRWPKAIDAMATAWLESGLPE